MNFVNCKTFDLDRVRPKVLLIGNGLTYKNGVPWPELIRKTARPDADVSRYEREDTEGNRWFAVPNTVLTLAVSETGDRERHARYVEALEQKSYPENERIRELLAMPFDAVLTTNYTYELEAALLPKYPALSNDSKRKRARTIEGKQDRRFLLYTFNRVTEGGPDIWHIHGELRRPSSMVLSHDEYARLVHEILAYNKSLRNKYVKERNNLKFQSWIDYLVLGDVYILGLGMDFSEFDLWWLLGRRLRERCDCGKVVFYEPEKEDNVYKQRALSDAGVEVNTCGIEIRSHADYDVFYERAIEHIRTMTASQ